MAMDTGTGVGSVKFSVGEDEGAHGRAMGDRERALPHAPRSRCRGRRGGKEGGRSSCDELCGPRPPSPSAVTAVRPRGRQCSWVGRPGGEGPLGAPVRAPVMPECYRAPRHIGLKIFPQESRE